MKHRSRADAEVDICELTAGAAAAMAVRKTGAMHATGGRACGTGKQSRMQGTGSWSSSVAGRLMLRTYRHPLLCALRGAGAEMCRNGGDGQ